LILCYNRRPCNTAKVYELKFGLRRRIHFVVGIPFEKQLTGWTNDESHACQGSVVGAMEGSWRADWGDGRSRPTITIIIKIRSGSVLLPFRSTMHALYPSPMWSSSLSTASREYITLSYTVNCNYTDIGSEVKKKPFTPLKPKYVINHSRV